MTLFLTLFLLAASDFDQVVQSARASMIEEQEEIQHVIAYREDVHLQMPGFERTYEMTVYADVRARRVKFVMEHGVVTLDGDAFFSKGMENAHGIRLTKENLVTAWPQIWPVALLHPEIEWRYQGEPPIAPKEDEIVAEVRYQGQVAMYLTIGVDDHLVRKMYAFRPDGKRDSERRLLEFEPRLGLIVPRKVQHIVNGNPVITVKRSSWRWEDVPADFFSTVE